MKRTDKIQYLHRNMDLPMHEKKDSNIVFNPFTGNSFIVLRSGEVNLGHFFDTFIQDIHEIFDRLTLNNEIVHTLIGSMDSEWDRKVARVLVGANRTRAELHQL